MSNNIPTNVGQELAEVYITPKDKIITSRAAVEAYCGISSGQRMSGYSSSHAALNARDTYSDIDTRTSVRNQFTREDYDKFRPQESTPKKQKEIISFCMAAYRRVGIIHNIIDLMGDFACQGVDIIHPNKEWQNFLRAWFRKVNGKERSERFLNMLYRSGNVVVQRAMIKPKSAEVKKYRTEGEKLENDMEAVDTPNPRKGSVPGKYIILNPLSMEIIGGELAQFTDKRLYGMKIPFSVIQKINYPNNEMERKIVAELPQNVINAVKNGSNLVVLDEKKISTYFYKKDDWQSWADPMIYCIFDDILMLEKMKLADLSALDGAISQIRLWKLGSLEHEIYPNEDAIAALANILLSNTGGGAFDLIWGPELTLEETGTDVHKFLGSQKYEPVWTAIYGGLGIPQTLTGTSKSGGGFTNNFIAIQTLVRRLEYGRMILTMFWEQELELIQKSMGFKKKASIVFDRMTLSDEAAERALLIQLADRGYLSEETLLERYGELPEIEMIRRYREEKNRKSGKLPAKAGPWHSPEKPFELTKIALQNGLVTPGEVGIELEERKEGEKTNQEVMMELKKSQVSSTNKGEPQQGRPKNSKDTVDRKKKTVKPRGSAKAGIESIENTQEFLSNLQWANAAQYTISEIVNPAILQHYGKKNMRSLTSEEFASAEKMKFGILCGLEMFSEVNGVSIYSALSNKVPKEARMLYNKFYDYLSDKKELTIDECRNIQSVVKTLI